MVVEVKVERLLFGVLFEGFACEGSDVVLFDYNNNNLKKKKKTIERNKFNQL